MNNPNTLTTDGARLLQDVEGAVARLSRRTDRHNTEIRGLSGVVGAIGQRVTHETKMAIPPELIPPEMFARANANRDDITALNTQLTDLNHELGIIQASIKSAMFLLAALEERTTEIELRLDHGKEALTEQDTRIFRQLDEVRKIVERYRILERAIRALMVLEA